MTLKEGLMHRHIKSFILCLFLLVVMNNYMAPSVKESIQIGESFISALKVRDFEKLSVCFHPDIQIGFLTPNRSGKVTGHSIYSAVVPSSQETKMASIKHEVLEYLS
jgi:hypothetical protein